MLKSFYWHDYETFGANPAMDWPSQFAGIRTDAELNEIGEPLNIYCKQPLDHLPNPVAAVVTGLSPQEVNSKGMIEPEFMRLIHHEFMQSGTCGVGYNSLRFDDEVTRHALYRNFYDPYAREWQNGNSRWDLIDMVRLAGAIRPDGIEWPLREDGFKSFRLEELTEANGISHGHAHDALSDVRATIGMAKLVRDRQRKLFDYVLNLRNKHVVSKMLNLAQQDMVVHVSGMFGGHRNNLAVIVPLANHPINKNGIVVYDLAVDPAPLLDLSAEQIRERLFTPVDQLPEGVERIPLKTVHINKCPVIAPIKVLSAQNQNELNIDLALCEKHRQQLLDSPELVAKVQAVFSERPDNGDGVRDPEKMLYSGGFFSSSDKGAMSQIVASAPEQLASLSINFQDARLEEMLLRYRGRHYPGTLDDEDRQAWLQFCRDRLSGKLHPGDKTVLNFGNFGQAMAEAKELATEDSAKLSLLREVESYVQQSRRELSLELSIELPIEE